MDAGSSRRRSSRNIRRHRSPTPGSTPSPLSSYDLNSPPVDIFDIHFSVNAMREKWNSQFRAIDVEIEKDYDFNSLNGAFNFTNALTSSGLITLFQLLPEAYTDLV